MKEQIGQLFITGFDSETPSEEFLDFFLKENIGGIILFEENCNPHSKAEDTIQKISSEAVTVPFIGVDQEGGRVCRFRGAPAEFPSAEEFASRKGLESFRESFGRSAYYLHSLGVNLLFAPVADLRINTENSVLLGRTFGKSSARAIPFVNSAVKQAHGAGLLSCVKHFPGLGAAKVDPHVAVAIADFDMQSFLNRESLTFKAGIDAGTDMVMTTHMSVPSLDNKTVTASEIVVGVLLREKLDYDGVIITDDLLMKGADYLGSYGERALKAFNAGHDILLFGRDYKAAGEAVAFFKDAYDKGLISDDRLEASLDRVNGLKSKISTTAII